MVKHSSLFRSKKSLLTSAPGVGRGRNLDLAHQGPAQPGDPGGVAGGGGVSRK